MNKLLSFEMLVIMVILLSISRNTDLMCFYLPFICVSDINIGGKHGLYIIEKMLSYLAICFNDVFRNMFYIITKDKLIFYMSAILMFIYLSIFGSLPAINLLV